MIDYHLTPAGEIVDGGRVLFARAELACRASGGLRLHPGFADRLAELRLAYGRPMVVTSCCRSAAHNRAVGGHPRSLHVYDDSHHGAAGCLAIDVRRAAVPAHDIELVIRALRSGWSVGQAKTFIHLDRRVDLGLPQRTFGYG